ncbi:MAG: ribose ABC transporter permease [Clostridia bacterium]|nr:ribose ABC transporter permease [Clostridia bacterium]
MKNKESNHNNSVGGAIARPFVNYFKRNSGILIGLALLIVILSIATPNFMNSKNLLTVLRQICQNALLAFGMTCVLIVGGIDLTVGSVFGVSGVAIVMLLNGGMALIPAFVISMLLGMVIGAVNGTIIAFTGMPPFIVTLSLQQVIRGIAFIITNGRAVSSKHTLFNSIGNAYYFGIPAPIYFVAVCMIIISVILYHTKLGRRMYAIGGNTNAAKFSGIRIPRVVISAYTISGAMAALSGIILASRMYSGQPTAGEGYESDAIAASVLGGVSFSGGVGTIGGVILGALVIGVLNNGLNLLKVSSYMQMVVKGIVIIAAVGVDILKNRASAKA